MKTNYYLLSATGEDRPGIVAGLSETLFRHRCNIEDSAMMRLGSEFAIFLILSSKNRLSDSACRRIFSPQTKRFRLNIGLKPLTSAQARFHPSRGTMAVVRFHGPDRPGLVYRLTDCLARQRFNITDLSTHRTSAGRRPGFFLVVEGELQSGRRMPALKKSLARAAAALRASVSVEPILPQPL